MPKIQVQFLYFLYNYLNMLILDQTIRNKAEMELNQAAEQHYVYIMSVFFPFLYFY